MFEGAFSLSLILFIVGPFGYSLVLGVLLWILIFHFSPLFFIGWVVTQAIMSIAFWQAEKFSTGRRKV